MKKIISAFIVCFVLFSTISVSASDVSEYRYDNVDELPAYEEQFIEEVNSSYHSMVGPRFGRDATFSFSEGFQSFYYPSNFEEFFLEKGQINESEFVSLLSEKDFEYILPIHLKEDETSIIHIRRTQPLTEEEKANYSSEEALQNAEDQVGQLSVHKGEQFSGNLDFKQALNDYLAENDMENMNVYLLDLNAYRMPFTAVCYSNEAGESEYPVILGLYNTKKFGKDTITVQECTAEEINKLNMKKFEVRYAEGKFGSGIFSRLYLYRYPVLISLAVLIAVIVAIIVMKKKKHSDQH